MGNNQAGIQSQGLVQILPPATGSKTDMAISLFMQNLWCLEIRSCC